MHVAPLVGAWIETEPSRNKCKIYKSHPSWVRGLKPLFRFLGLSLDWVAPLVGAWIETQVRAPFNYVALVAPLVGAWIET